MVMVVEVDREVAVRLDLVRRRSSGFYSHLLAQLDTDWHLFNVATSQALLTPVPFSPTAACCTFVPPFGNFALNSTYGFTLRSTPPL